MVIRRVLCTVSILFFLSSCKPVYEDKYVFIPPRDKSAVPCVNRCVRERESCMQRCMDVNSVLDFGNKVVSAFSNNNADSGDDKASKKCSAECNQTHRICHTNCGGEVRVDRVCTAFCGKTK